MLVYMALCLLDIYCHKVLHGIDPINFMQSLADYHNIICMTISIISLSHEFRCSLPGMRIIEFSYPRRTVPTTTPQNCRYIIKGVCLQPSKMFMHYLVLPHRLLPW